MASCASLDPGVLPGLVHDRRIGKIGLPVVAPDQLAGGGDRLFRHAHRVRSHVGDETDRAVLADIQALVEVLRRSHGASAGEAELLGGLLLQGAGGEGSRRPLPPLTLLHLRDGPGCTGRVGPAQRVHHGPRLGLVVKLRLVPVHLGERGLEGLPVLGEERLDGPVLLRLERADLPLAFHQEAQGDGLHPARGETGLDGSPENRAGLVADQTVEDPARLLGIHLPLVDLTRPLHRGEHRVAGDLLEEHAVSRHAGRDLVGDVPGDRLALAVGVGREIDLAGALGRLLQLRERLGLALDGDVLGLEPALDVHAELAGGQIAKMADGGLHVVAGAEILADGLGLGRRLDDHQRASAPSRSHPGLRGLGFGLGALGLFGRCLRGRRLYGRCLLGRGLLLYGALFSSRHVPSVTARGYRVIKFRR